MCFVRSDNGAIDYSVCGSQFIRRLDGTVVFDARPGVLFEWDVAGGVIAAAGFGTLAIVTPDGNRRDLTFVNGIHRIRIRDGYVYWQSAYEGTVSRVAISGGAAETIADALPIDGQFQFEVFGDKLLYITNRGLWVKPIAGGAAALLLPRSDITGISQVTADWILVSTSGSRPLEAIALLLRVPWSGAPVDQVDEVATATSQVPNPRITGVIAGNTTYVLGTGLTTTLRVIRDGLARDRAQLGGAFTVVEFDPEQITIARATVPVGLLEIDRLCAAAARTRAVR